ncbi:MAG TPA: type III-B CRISPR module RAMP protein Cmr6 [Nitrospirae bacterium]|nr:type III-B CRISPR module RAMP protein Cmr6 [Nitrospirota bacterium]
MFIPLPTYINIDNQKSANYSLLFNKWTKFSGDFNRPTKLGDEKIGEFIRLKTEFGNRTNQFNELIRLQKSKMTNLLSILKTKSYFVSVIKCRVSDALICGIGDEHTLENSMRFDHCTGLPFIPSSSIKGVVRFAGEFNNENDEREEGKENLIFGSKDGIGEVQFWDGFPSDVPKLKTDIMNNHFQDYYSDPTGTKAPSDDMNPNPVPFIVVDADSEFYFPVIAEDENNLIRAVEFLKCALSDWGVGAKSSVGYGMFYDFTEEIISLPKPKPKELTASELAFEDLKKAPNSESFVNWLETLKETDERWLSKYERLFIEKEKRMVTPSVPLNLRGKEKSPLLD